MAQRSLFFNDTETEQRVYFAEDEARYNYLMMAGQGIAKQGDYESYKVEPKQNMVVTIGAGAAFIKGYLHEVYDTAEELTLDAADPTNDRIDRIVLRFINVTTEREIRLEVLKGTPSANPTPPSVTRGVNVIELSIAQIRVIAGKSFIEESQITDEKNDPLVCGYSPLHNLMRGVLVNEVGMVTLPNQSYVEMNDSTSVSIAGDSSNSSYVGTFLDINPTIDRQSEISNGIFYPKSDGTYAFTIHVSMDNIVDNGSKFEASVIINDVDIANERVYLFNREGIGTRDSNFFGFNIKYLKAGDKVQLKLGTLTWGGNKTSRQRRFSIAKLN